MKRFSDFAEEQTMLGDKIKIDDILNKEITVLSYAILKSKYQNNNDVCLKMQVEIDGEKRVVFTGSTVLISQIEKYRNELPFIAVIKRVEKFYTFT